MDSSLPHRMPGVSGQEQDGAGLEYGVPSRELRERGAEGWQRFLDRFFGEHVDEEVET
ncbi:hypothetical protein [Streptomyces sp. NPDC058527]|uniref:hypothetical protein n=1 Tax=unclassified Streptomyces TaxID=2593676 RepID=UPI0036494A59